MVTRGEMMNKMFDANSKEEALTEHENILKSMLKETKERAIEYAKTNDVGGYILTDDELLYRMLLSSAVEIRETMMLYSILMRRPEEDCKRVWEYFAIYDKRLDKMRLDMTGVFSEEVLA